MKIVMASKISGTRNGLDWPDPGTELELPDEEAADLVVSGAAVAADDEDKVTHIRGTVPLTDEQLGGAPAARDITLGQPDTNLARARAVANSGEAEARAAADRVGLDVDDKPGQDQPKVGEADEAEGFRDPLLNVEAADGGTPAETAAVSNTPKKRPARPSSAN